MKTKAQPDGAWPALDRLRIERGWTLRELSGLVGMPISTLHSAIRRGRAERTTTRKARRFLELHNIAA